MSIELTPAEAHLVRELVTSCRDTNRKKQSTLASGAAQRWAIHEAELCGSILAKVEDAHPVEETEEVPT